MESIISKASSAQESIDNLTDVRASILDAEKFIQSTLESAPTAWVGAFNNVLVVIISKLLNAVKEQKITLVEFGKYEERVITIAEEVQAKVSGSSEKDADKIFSDEERKQWIKELEHILD